MPQHIARDGHVRIECRDLRIHHQPDIQFGIDWWLAHCCAALHKIEVVRQRPLETNRLAAVGGACARHERVAKLGHAEVRRAAEITHRARRLVFGQDRFRVLARLDQPA